MNKFNHKYLIKNTIWSFLNYHYKSDRKDIVIFTTRRSGGTWFTNIIESNKKIKSVNEPLSQALPEDIKQKKYLPKDYRTKYLHLDIKGKKWCLNILKKFLMVI